MDIPYDSPLSGEILVQVKVKEFENPMLVKSSLSFFLKGLEARTQGLAELVNHNPIEINITNFRMLSSGSGSDDNIIKLALQLCANNLNQASSLLRDNSLDPRQVFISSYLPPTTTQIEDITELSLPTSTTPIKQPISTQTTTTPTKLTDEPKTDRQFVQSRTEPTQTSQPQQTKQSQPNNEINLDLLDVENLENDDISKIIGGIAMDEDEWNGTALEEMENILSVDVCPICKEDKESLKEQLISCTKCNQKYHTICLKKDRIPFNSTSSMEKRKRDEYVSFALIIWIVMYK